ncbi:hypothetical protein LEN26_007745 [Aphanomyces euteiches]|nr:hypothetical protein LEN26_007745 [Aphanomyces euteiches]
MRGWPFCISHMKYKKLKLPVPPGFFRCPPLDEKARVAYTQQGQRALEELVDKTQLHGGSITWSFDHSARGVSVYRGVDASVPVFLRMTEIRGTLAEAAHLMSIGSDNQDYCASYQADTIVDVQTLYVLAEPTPKRPHHSTVVKWQALETKFMSTRDVCILQCQDDVMVQGTPGFARCVQSVDMPFACPDLERPFGLVRAQVILGGDVFLKSPRPGYITVFRLSHIDLRSGGLPAWAHGFLGKSHLTKDVQAVDMQLRQQRINHSAFLPMKALVPLHTRTHCALCRNKFSALATKTHCRKCGEVVCDKCHQMWQVSDGPAALRSQTYCVCTTCSSMPLPDAMMLPPTGVLLVETVSVRSMGINLEDPFAKSETQSNRTLSIQEADDLLLSNPRFPFYFQSSQCGSDDDIPIMMSGHTDYIVDLAELPRPASPRHILFEQLDRVLHRPDAQDNDEILSNVADADDEAWK